MVKERISILLADSQYLSRAGMRHLLLAHPHLEVVGEAGDESTLWECMRSLTPDLVVTDYANGPEFHLKTISDLRKQHPSSHVLVITDDQDHGRIRQLIDMGVNCILTKHCGPEEILSAISATVRSEKFFCNKVLEVILDRASDRDDCTPSNLSPREVEILRLVASGVGTKEIADQLCLSTHTVYTHRKNILKKLGIKSASEMVLYAMKVGIATPPTT